MRKPSAETENRTLRSVVARSEAARMKLHTDYEAMRGRATRAEQEVAEWKRRFDALLARTPEVSK